MKKFMIIGLGFALFGMTVPAPTAQALELNNISLEEAYERAGSKFRDRRPGIGRLIRDRSYRSPFLTENKGVDRRRFLNSVPRKPYHRLKSLNQSAELIQNDNSDDAVYYRRARNSKR